ncbi:MAG: arginase family protein [Acidimicrobiales bacterium]|jgi:arginase
MFFLPWHLSDSLSAGLNVALPPRTIQLGGEPDTTGDPWRDLIGVYAPLADAVAQDEARPTVVISGDCMASLAVLAGVQRRGVQPSLVWFDAHGDFHTEASTTSGYLGGLPLAKAVGRGNLTLPAALGLTSLSDESVTLVDGRDLDPAEAAALAASRVRRVAVGELDATRLPEGPMVVHVDVDTVDPSELAGLRFPSPDGPTLRQVADALGKLVGKRPLAALDIGATWRPGDTIRAQTDAVLSALLSSIGLRY